jgi:hypothetical protein
MLICKIGLPGSNLETRSTAATDVNALIQKASMTPAAWNTGDGNEAPAARRSAC